MKILFFHIPCFSMYRWLEPVLLELRGRGHQVIHYNDISFRRYIHDVPICFVPYDNYKGYFPHACDSAMNLYEFGLLLLETAEHMADFVEKEVLRESPHLILHTKFNAAPKMIAMKRGVPAACLTTGFVLHPRTILNEVQKRHAPVCMDNVSSFLQFRTKAKQIYRRHLGSDVNVDVDDIFINDEALNLVFGLEALQPSISNIYPRGTIVGSTVRIEHYSKSYDLVYASLGAVFVNNKQFFQMCIEALGRVGRRAVVSLGGGFVPEQFDNVPCNVEVHRFVEQKEILQEAAVFITQGGDCSVAEAIYCETPMIVVPQISEQQHYAQRIQHLKIGKYINPSDLTADLLQATVVELLDNHVFRHNVQALKHSLPATSSATIACDQIEEFALKNRSGLGASK